MKTAAELGITEIEREAMIATISVLEREQIIFNMSRSCMLESEDEDDEDENGDLVGPRPTPPCGTNACIGGTMSLLMQNGMKLPAIVTPHMAETAENFVWAVTGKQGALNRLFFDRTEGDETPAEGIAAIRRFLGGNTRDPWLTNPEHGGE